MISSPIPYIFDIKTNSAVHAAAMRRRYAEAGVAGCDSLAEAVAPARIILSLVTADQTLMVAQAAAAFVQPGSHYLDMNSAAPPTKQAAAAAIMAAGGHYVDVAVMAPVEPARLAVPLLISGGGADAAANLLGQLGFSQRRIVGPAVGRASAIKMIRSVMVKGIEALTAEMLLASEAAGVTDEVLASLGADAAARADYSLDRMLSHGTRRAAEMVESAKTLTALGVEPLLTRGIIARHSAIGALGIAPPPGLGDKLAAIAVQTPARAA